MSRLRLNIFVSFLLFFHLISMAVLLRPLIFLYFLSFIQGVFVQGFLIMFDFRFEKENEADEAEG